MLRLKSSYDWRWYEDIAKKECNRYIWECYSAVKIFGLRFSLLLTRRKSRLRAPEMSTVIHIETAILENKNFRQELIETSDDGEETDRHREVLTCKMEIYYSYQMKHFPSRRKGGRFEQFDLKKLLGITKTCALDNFVH